MSEVDGAAHAVDRGRLRVYLGAAPGVGKTVAMLAEGLRRAERGASVAIGAVDTRGRQRTRSALEELSRLCGTDPSEPDELDVDAVLRADPDVVLVDDLERVNAPGSTHARRYEDVDDLLAQGVDVVATLNVQHLTSLTDVVQRIGLDTGETVPDVWVRRADQVELVDMAPEALQRRMAHGNVFRADDLDSVRSNFFSSDNLATMRLFALTWVADWVEERLHDSLVSEPSRSHDARERVVVAVTGAPGNDQIIRRAALIAQRSRGVLLGVHVHRAEVATSQSPELDGCRQLVEDLGGTMREGVGDDIAETLVDVARSHRATQIVVGASRRSMWHQLTGGSVLNRLLRLAGELDVHVISSDPAPELSPTRQPRKARATVVSRQRRLTAWAMVVVGLPAITGLLIWVRDDLGVATSLMVALGFVVSVSAIGGLRPGLVAAVAGAVAANYHVVPPTGTLKVSTATDLLALLVFLAVGATVAVLVDRVALRSLESARARAEAAWLARAAATQAVEADPLPGLANMLRASLELDSVSVLRSSGDGWDVLATAGPSPPQSSGEGHAWPLGDDGSTVVVARGGLGDGRDPLVVDAFLDQLAVAVRRRDLQSEAAAAAALAEANELRNGILQAVSHDLRTPLSGIKASVTSLLAPDLRFDRQDTELFLHTIQDEVDRLDRVVGNLLDMSRLQSGSIPLLVRPTPLEEVVSAALRSVGAEPGSVDVDVPETLPLVQLDGALLERAVANVVANALAVQPNGVPVRIDAGEVGGPNSGCVLMRVVDVGPGVAARDRVKVIEPFQRLGDRSTQAGVGLGLAIANGFCDAMGAALLLDDTPGGGLTVSMRLPLCEPSPGAPTAEGARQ